MKAPQLSLYSVVKSKQLVSFMDSESLILPNVVASLGHKLMRNSLFVASLLFMKGINLDHAPEAEKWHIQHATQSTDLRVKS